METVQGLELSEGMVLVFEQKWYEWFFLWKLFCWFKSSDDLDELALF